MENRYLNGLYLLYSFVNNQLTYAGFMKQMPNLLKQESSSAATYTNIMMRMYNDNRDSHQESKNNVEQNLIP